MSAGAEQAELVETVIVTRTPTVTLAMHTPYDLGAYPGSTTHICTYSILEPSLGDILFGKRKAVGHLPVAIPGLSARGHGSPVS